MKRATRTRGESSRGTKIAPPHDERRPPVPEGAPRKRARRIGRGLIRLLGILSLLAAVGLVLPWLLGGDTWLLSLSAVVLCGSVLLFVLSQLVRRRSRPLAANLALLALAAAVAYLQMGELFWVGVTVW